MKHYQKIHQDICDISEWPRYYKHIGSTSGTLDELVVKFRGFYRDAHLSIFDNIIKEIWLEQQITIHGERRAKRVGNGQWGDLSFGKFTKIAVGTTHRVLTANFCFTRISVYLIDFFPEFLFHDPFENPEEYKYPYKHVTLDFLVFVYQMDNRLEILDYAEKMHMSYAEFVNWVTNWFLCYNMDIKKDKYSLISGNICWPYVRNNDLKKFWENDKFNFDVKQ